jgi:IS5 family transposase
MRRKQRKGGEIAGELQHKVQIAQRLYDQRRDSKNKLYALHAPEVECLAKGKARTPYEFGVKVSVAVTAGEGLVVGMRSMPGNPYDGHTVDSQLEQVQILTGHTPKIALADRGYRGVEPPAGTRLPISHTPAAALVEGAAQASTGGRADDRAHEERRPVESKLAQGR